MPDPTANWWGVANAASAKRPRFAPSQRAKLCFFPGATRGRFAYTALPAARFDQNETYAYFGAGFALKELIKQLRAGIDLRSDQVREAAAQLADPAVSEAPKADFLVALKEKGESGAELGYFACSFLDLAMRPVLDLDNKPSVDIVGTGGDRLELINVSTTCTFLLAAAGVVVLKHGNRAITSRSGAADVLEVLGIAIDAPPEQMADCIHQTGLGFFFAPLYHPSFRVIAPVRRKLADQGVSTVFNLLGPLLNPAMPAYQLTGVFSPAILERYAMALREVGRSCAWVVHGQVPDRSGMDEISLLGATQVHEVTA
ncbi:MAG TPA: anthranilate phosphoribosyltransferase, partial [Chthoniobacterales bacterium]|nr:anthranilate phosphoribosyltransferase [Chthoniobacterales bacterium]